LYCVFVRASLIFAFPKGTSTTGMLGSSLYLRNPRRLFRLLAVVSLSKLDSYGYKDVAALSGAHLRATRLSTSQHHSRVEVVCPVFGYDTRGHLGRAYFFKRELALGD